MSNQPVKVSQIEAMIDGQVIPAISGTLTRIYERKSGTHAHGEWSIQNGEITDDDGKSIKVQFKDRPEVTEAMQGKYIALASKTTDMGTHGVKVFDDEYPVGTKTRKLKITGSAGFAEVAKPSETAKPYDEPFEDAPTAERQAEAPEYYPDIEVSKDAAAYHKSQQEKHEAPAGVNVTKITYREVRQKHEYEPVTCELELSIQPGTTLASAWKYAEQAADAMLKHSTNK